MVLDLREEFGYENQEDKIIQPLTIMASNTHLLLERKDKEFGLIFLIYDIPIG